MDLTEQQLIQLAKQGAQDAMEAIFRRHVESAVRLAYLITRDWATAEDAVQEAFLRAFGALHTFQDDRPFQPWFTRSVVNQAKRTKSRFQTGDVPYEVEVENPHRLFAPEEHLAEKEKLNALFAAINELDDNHRLPLLLKYVSGLSEAETAEVLGVPVTTVKSRLYTARQRLKKHMAQLEGRD